MRWQRLQSSVVKSTFAWSWRSRPEIEIRLVGQKPQLVNSYTTGDQIEGTAIITVEHETPFDEVEIVLQGKFGLSKFIPITRGTLG